MTNGTDTNNTDSGNSPTGGGAPPAATAGRQQTAQRPDWLPEAHWDGGQNAIKPEFGAHYSELATFKQQHDERQAALAARKPEDIKIEVRLPDTVKVPDGAQIKIDEKDPRIPLIRQMAIENGWDQPVVDKLVALDTQMKIDAFNAEVERIAAEDKKLGDNGKARKDAVLSWAKGLLDRKDITADEFEELRMTGATAAGVTLLEKIMEKANGSVPGAGGNQPAPKPTARIEDRLYPNLARNSNPARRAS